VLPGSQRKANDELAMTNRPARRHTNTVSIEIPNPAIRVS
jgi:hypothetical protein